MIVGEALSRMISKAREANLIKGFKLSASGPTITHLQIADDTLIFCPAETDQVKNVIVVLRCFEAVSGQKVNFFKSVIFGISVEEQVLQRLAGMMG